MAVNGNSSWKSEKLEVICAQITDGKHGDCQDEPNSGFYFLSCKDVSNGKLNYEGARQITKVDFLDTHRRTKFEPSDVLITNSGTIGRMALAPNNELTHRTTFQKSVAILKPITRRITPNFLYYALQSDIHRLIEFAGGTAQKNLLLRDLRAFEVRVPPLPVQQRIAGILSAHDELIENNQRRIRIVEDMARSLYREWFVHFRYPGHESVPPVNSSLGQIPQGWEVKSLSDVCSRITDGSHFSPPSVEDGYPMASVKDMHDWGVNLESCRRITSVDYENLVRNDCKPRKNDVLIAKDGSYLKHTFVVGEEQDLVILSSIAMLRPNESIRPNYLSFSLRDPVTKARMKGIVSGVAIPRIVLKDFRKFQILVPPYSIQADWTKLVDPMIEMCRKLVAQTENLRRTRDLLLPRLLSGQVALATVEP